MPRYALPPLVLVLLLLLGCAPAAKPRAAESRSERRPSSPTVVESIVRAATPTIAPTPRPTEQAVVAQRPIAVIVENAADARPQTGLDMADLVYEAMAEGGISRFMAVYVREAPSVVGPVRSARHYFVNIAAELGAPLVHFGASPQAYDQLAATGLPSVDGIKGSTAIWRESRRAAPHNAYTSIPAARASLADAWPRPRTVLPIASGLSPSPSPSPQARTAQRLELAFRPWPYRVRFDYDERQRTYVRSTDGEIHRDARTGEPLRAGSVAVLTVPASVIDGSGRLDLALRGEGDLALISDGMVERGRWQKRTAAEPMRFVAPTGVMLPPGAGPVWIEIVQPETLVEIAG